ncbi:hypothetical protein GUJ93_ZPchr0125g33410 [Zizania palustris]|uniref:Polygalacturonase n=1 Tax=Zizania palustris TaxID=103762 RepID=A0A8J5V337_ZIZPA|nr:hypothetical protein GUJ93_ZPchr0125g33410 [Zizania palustris]
MILFLTSTTLGYLLVNWNDMTYYVIHKENIFKRAGDGYWSFDPARQDRFVQRWVDALTDARVTHELGGIWIPYWSQCDASLGQQGSTIALINCPWRPMSPFVVISTAKPSIVNMDSNIMLRPIVLDRLSLSPCSSTPKENGLIGLWLTGCSCCGRLCFEPEVAGGEAIAHRFSRPPVAAFGGPGKAGLGVSLSCPRRLFWTEKNDEQIRICAAADLLIQPIDNLKKGISSTFGFCNHFSGTLWASASGMYCEGLTAKCMFYLSSFAEKGGAELFVPAGRWLTGSFNLISYLTLSLDRDAVIIGSQDSSDWPSLIFGSNLTDVIITGANGTIDGQGEIWWNWFHNHTLNYTRPPLVELMYSNKVVISNLTFMNAPFWNIHPVYCSQVLVQHLTILAPISSPNTDGIDPDSSTNVCIEDCYIRNGDDIVVIKSGWDEFGISFGQPSSNISIRNITGVTRNSAGIAFGSEMSGGISEVRAEGLRFVNSVHGIRIKTAQGVVAIRITGNYGEHPDDNYDKNALPDISNITIKDVVGLNIEICEQLRSNPGPGVCYDGNSYPASTVQQQAPQKSSASRASGSDHPSVALPCAPAPVVLRRLCCAALMDTPTSPRFRDSAQHLAKGR